MQQVELVGEMPDLADFYGRIDLAANPVQFGTGLKIKNVEAMAYGIPLITTPQGAAGMSDRACKGCIVARDLMDMPRHLLGLARDPDRRRQLAETAREVAQSEFSDQHAFAELRDFLAPLA
jgi:glycosyltransferase involved in cell wall biosynthesis